MSKVSDYGKHVTLNPKRETYIVITSIPAWWQITTPVHVLDGRRSNDP